MNIFTGLLRLFSYLNASATYQSKIAKLFEVEKKHVHALYQEVLTSQFVSDIARKRGLQQGAFDFSMLCVLRAPTLYVICRIIKPEIVVETGVADGFSSSFILRALEENKDGHLYSIDLPNQKGQEIKLDKNTGWIIPDNLRKRWDLILGSSSDKLSPLLEKLKTIDAFYHDSDHSYQNMIYEFNVALPYLKEDGIIISDDITDNRSFNDFCKTVNGKNLELFKLGIVRPK